MSKYFMSRLSDQIKARNHVTELLQIEAIDRDVSTQSGGRVRQRGPEHPEISRYRKAFFLLSTSQNLNAKVCIFNIWCAKAWRAAIFQYDVKQTRRFRHLPVNVSLKEEGWLKCEEQKDDRTVEQLRRRSATTWFYTHPNHHDDRPLQGQTSPI